MADRKKGNKSIGIHHIGINIRQLRNLNSYSLAALAKKLNISGVALCKIENGHTDINLSRITQIAEVFGLSASQLYNFNNNNIIENHIEDDIENLLKEKDQELLILQSRVISLYDEILLLLTND